MSAPATLPLRYDPRGSSVKSEKSFGRWLQLVKAGDTDTIEKVYGPCFSKTAMAESSGTAGGYLVPRELLLDLLEPLNENTILWPRCPVIPMGSFDLDLPLLDVIDLTPAGVAGLLGGIEMNWTVEENQIAETAEPKFYQVELRAQQLAGVCAVSNNLLKDQPALEKWLRMIFSEAIGWYSEFAFLQGSGVGQPTGILNAAATVKVTRTSPGNFLQQDAAAMLGSLYPSGISRAVWLLSDSVFKSLTTNNAWGAWVFEPIERDGSCASIFGHPAFVTEKLPALGTYGDVVLMDPRAYIIGDRQEVEVMASPYTQPYYGQNQTLFRIVWRGDGQPQFSKQFDLQDASTIVGPFSALQ